MSVYEMALDDDDELGLMELKPKPPKPNRKFTIHKIWTEFEYNHGHEESNDLIA